MADLAKTLAANPYNSGGMQPQPQPKPNTSVAAKVVESRYPTTLGGNLWNAFQMTNVGMATVGPPEWAKDRRAQLDASRGHEARATQARADMYVNQADESDIRLSQLKETNKTFNLTNTQQLRQNELAALTDEDNYELHEKKYAVAIDTIDHEKKLLPEKFKNDIKRQAIETKRLDKEKEQLTQELANKKAKLDNDTAQLEEDAAKIARAAFAGGTTDLVAQEARYFTIKNLVVNRIGESQEKMLLQYNETAKNNAGMAIMSTADGNTLMSDPDVMRLNSLTAIARRHGEIIAADPSLVGKPHLMLEDDIIKALMEWEGLEWVPDATGSDKGKIIDTVGGFDPKTGKHVNERIEVYAGIFNGLKETIALENRELLDRFAKAATYLKDPKGHLFREVAGQLGEVGVGRLQALEQMTALMKPGARYRAAIDSPVVRNERGEPLPVEGERVELIDQQKMLAASVLSFALTLEPGSEKLEEVLVGLEQFKTLLGVDVLNEAQLAQGMPIEDLIILDPTTGDKGLKVREWLAEVQRTSPLFTYMQGLAGEHRNAFEVKRREDWIKSITLTNASKDLGSEYQVQTELGEMVILPKNDYKSMSMNVFSGKSYIPPEVTLAYNNYLLKRGLNPNADSYQGFLMNSPPRFANMVQEQISAYILGLNMPAGQGAAKPLIGHVPKTTPQSTEPFIKGWQIFPPPPTEATQPIYGPMSPYGAAAPQPNPSVLAPGSPHGTGAGALLNVGQQPGGPAAALLNQSGNVNVANASNPQAATAAVQGQQPAPPPEPDWAKEGWAYTPTEAQVKEMSTLLAELLAPSGQHKIPSELVQEFLDAYMNDPVKGKEVHHELKWTNHADRPKAESDRNFVQNAWFATGRGIGAGYAHVVQQLKALGAEKERGDPWQGSHDAPPRWTPLGEHSDKPNLGQQPIGKPRPYAGEPNFINEGFINLAFPDIDWSPIPKGTAEKVVKNNPEFAKLARELHIKKFPKGTAKSLPADDHRFVEWAFRQQVAFNVQGKKYQDLLTKFKADPTTRKLFAAWSAQYDKAMEDSKETDHVGGVGKYVLTQRPKTKAATAAANKRARLLKQNAIEEAARLEKQRKENLKNRQ